MLIHKVCLRLWRRKLNPKVHTHRHILGENYIGAIEGDGVYFTERTTHARKGLPALLTLQVLSKFLECLCELCTQYPYISQTWALLWDGTLC